jgi:hypothetical protein
VATLLGLLDLKHKGTTILQNIATTCPMTQYHILENLKLLEECGQGHESTHLKGSSHILFQATVLKFASITSSKLQDA